MSRIVICGGNVVGGVGKVVQRAAQPVPDIYNFCIFSGRYSIIHLVSGNGACARVPYDGKIGRVCLCRQRTRVNISARTEQILKRCI